MSGSTTITAPQFRLDQPAFADPNLFPDTAINNYLTIAQSLFQQQTWAQFWTLGVECWTAHFLILDMQAAKASATGATPGVNPGMVASKGLGPGSIGYDSSSQEKNAGMWNATTYGRRFIHFARLVGMGGAQLSPQGPIPGSWFPGTSFYPIFGGPGTV